MTKVILLVAALALTVTAAVAEDTGNANSVMPGCRSWVKNERADTTPIRQGFCAGSVNAIVFMADAMKSTLGVDPDRASMLPNLIRDLMCVNLPSTATVGQAILVII